MRTHAPIEPQSTARLIHEWARDKKIVITEGLAEDLARKIIGRNRDYENYRMFVSRLRTLISLAEEIPVMDAKLIKERAVTIAQYVRCVIKCTEFEPSEREEHIALLHRALEAEMNFNFSPERQSKLFNDLKAALLKASKK